MTTQLSQGNGAQPAAERDDEERLGWRTFRPPPTLGVAFGVVYGAIAGAIIAYDVTVLIRLGRILRARIQERREHRDE
jgi:hypothetical protein